ncbi:OLC1v1007636C2 [Oldenlandia corymbosa var. corymbosa]|uniref:OLC1v1007636C2 n=1 Tax=Oldenlandia corymbosa var. corymbosa TaxID=529605 RepID=A0AAV1DJN2_OLDCO|nr:OLC1v1007636C2 [Oldenlandia corymbosa var. corymbosa]
MAGTCSPVKPHFISSSKTTSYSPVENSRSSLSRAGARCSVVRYSSLRSSVEDFRPLPPVEGPSCIFVGPIESASKETLEALYRQARDSYYNGRPLIVDDMFDRVELRLRRYGSKYVVKYPRCSLRRQSTYSDAEEDPSQVFALASVWLLILGFGGLVFLVPVIYSLGHAYNDAFLSGNTSTSQASMLHFLTVLNGFLYMLLGSVIGYPIASASVGALQGIMKNDVVALKGACPNCGEEVSFNGIF